MQKPKIAIRADGNAKIGLGHIHRTLALASYLKDLFEIKYYSAGVDSLVTDLITSNGYEVTSLNEPNNVSAFIKEISKKNTIVLDGYNFKTEYQSALKVNGNKVVAIDDLNEWENVADVVINHAYSGNRSEYKLATSTKFYAGLEYAMIKKEVLNYSNSKPKTSADKILVCIGGTDPDNYSEKIVNELLKNTSKIIALLTYPINPKFETLRKLSSENSSRLKLYHSINTGDLIKVISENDMAILQPSNIALEAAAIGIHISLIQTAENQKYILETLVKGNCAVNLQVNALSDQINSVTVDEINRQIENQGKLLDKRSPDRILEIFNSLLLECRPVNENDIKLIYDWNNDPVTRANSHNQARIEYADHEKWFGSKIKDETVTFLIFSYNVTPMGTVRIERKETENVVSISIGPEFRGKKLAGLMLDMAASHFYKNYGKREITAYIKKQNIASIKSFEKVGYKIVNAGTYCGDEGYKLIKTV